MNRRKLLQTGLITSSAGLLGTNTVLNSALATNGMTKSLPLDHFIFDERFTASSNVASFLYQDSVIKHKMSGDLTKIWYQHLDAAWKNSAITVAGVTTESALFYLQRLAWIHRVRLIYHGYHPVPVNEKVQHVLKGDDSLVANITGLNKQSWSSSLGMALTEGDTSLSVKDPIKININLPEPEHSQQESRDTILVSWVLAPLSSVT